MVRAYLSVPLKLSGLVTWLNTTLPVSVIASDIYISPVIINIKYQAFNCLALLSSTKNLVKLSTTRSATEKMEEKL